MNGDGRIDIVSAQRGRNNPVEGQVVIFLNPGDDTSWDKWRRVELGPKSFYARVAVGDVDHDGDMDIVALGGDGFGLVPDVPDKMRFDVRWFLSRGGDVPVFDAGVMSLEPCPCPPRCARAGASGGKSRPSSVAMADVDSDDDLDLVVTSYPDGPVAGVPLWFLFFDQGSRSFREKSEWRRCSKGAMRARFHDLDGDGRLDLVTSFYDVEIRGDPSHPTQWGQWWQLDQTGPQGPHALQVGLAGTFQAELTAIDFDVLQNPSATARPVLFAVALSAHHCATASCWDQDKAAGGFSVVTNAEGQETWSSEGLQRDERRRHPERCDQRLVPSVVRFAGDAAEPRLAVGFWWASIKNGTPCPNRTTPCPGPLLFIDTKTPDSGRFTETERFSQGIAPAAFRTEEITRRHRCEAGPAKLLSLAHAAVVSVTGVSRGGSPVPHHWVPGTRDIVLDDATPGHGETCADYWVAAGKRLAIADAYLGVLPVEDTDF